MPATRSPRPFRLALAPGMLVALLGLASPADSGGIDLRWDDCGSFGRPLRTSDCSSNEGALEVVLSVIPDAPTRMRSFGAVLHVTSAHYPFPSWWQLGPGHCRAGSLGASLDFTVRRTECIDPWQGRATGGMEYELPAGAGAGAYGRVRLWGSIPDAVEVSDIDEYSLVRVRIDFSRTTGGGACAGCVHPACIHVVCVRLDQEDGGTQWIGNPILTRMVSFQGGFAYPCGFSDVPPPECPAAAPARPTTWGRVKSSYR